MDQITELRAWASIEVRMDTGNLYVRGQVSGDRARRVRCVLTDRANVIHEERFGADEFVEGVSFRDIPMRAWWPNGAGDRPLYRLDVQLLDADDAVLDTAERRVGFKHVGWEGDTCVINERPIALKGADAVADRAQLERLQAEGVNMVRATDLAEDAFYDACDELGLLVWQTLPADAEEAVKRLQHHASLLQWSPAPGDSGAADRLAELVDRLDPIHRFTRLESL